MRHLLRNLEGRLATLPVPMATGEIGNVDAAIVEGRVALEGGMRDLMAAAAGLLIRDPARAMRSFTTTCRTTSTRCGWTRAVGIRVPTTVHPT